MQEIASEIGEYVSAKKLPLELKIVAYRERPIRMHGILSFVK